MSDTAVNNARMSDGLERTLIRNAIETQTMGAPMNQGGWRRLKLRATGFVLAVGDVLHAMDEGRQQHPVMSAHRR